MTVRNYIDDDRQTTNAELRRDVDVLRARIAALELEVLYATAIAAADLATCVRNFRRGHVSGEGTASGDHSHTRPDWVYSERPIKKCCRCRTVALHYSILRQATSVYCIDCMKTRPTLTAQRKRYEAKFTRPRINGKRVRVLREQGGPDVGGETENAAPYDRSVTRTDSASAETAGVANPHHPGSHALAKE